MLQTRQKIKEAYAAEFAATIERAEKQIILARHGRRILNLLDDSPVVPGDVRPVWEHTNQARQILNDAEDDLKDWQPELEDVPSHAHLDSALLPSSASQRYAATEGSVAGGESIAQEGEQLQQPGDTSRISSGASITTGPGPQSYVSSEEPRNTVV